MVLIGSVEDSTRWSSLFPSESLNKEEYAGMNVQTQEENVSVCNNHEILEGHGGTLTHFLLLVVRAWGVEDRADMITHVI